jgi:hypothetical protein
VSFSLVFDAHVVPVCCHGTQVPLEDGFRRPQASGSPGRVASDNEEDRTLGTAAHEPGSGKSE